MGSVEATSQRVQRILASKFNGVSLTDRGFSIADGSTAIFVEVREWSVKDTDGLPRTLVYIWAPLGREVCPSVELWRWAATEGRKQFFGGVNVYFSSEDEKQCNVTFDHTLLGDFLDPDELETAILAVGFVADDLDDVVHDRFGGKRYIDP